MAINRKLFSSSEQINYIALNNKTWNASQCSIALEKLNSHLFNITGLEKHFKIEGDTHTQAQQELRNARIQAEAILKDYYKNVFQELNLELSNDTTMIVNSYLGDTPVTVDWISFEALDDGFVSKIGDYDERASVVSNWRKQEREEFIIETLNQRASVLLSEMKAKLDVAEHFTFIIGLINHIKSSKYNNPNVINHIVLEGASLIPDQKVQFELYKNLYIDSSQSKVLLEALQSLSHEYAQQLKLIFIREILNFYHIDLFAHYLSKQEITTILNSANLNSALGLLRKLKPETALEYFFDNYLKWSNYAVQQAYSIFKNDEKLTQLINCHNEIHQILDTFKSFNHKRFQRANEASLIMSYANLFQASNEVEDKKVEQTFKKNSPR